MAKGVANEFRRFSDVELPHQAGAMGFDGLDADVESDRDFLGGKAFGDLVEHLSFPSGEQREGIFGGALWAAHLVHNFSRDGWAEVASALHHFPHSGDDFVCSAVLENVAVGAKRDGALNKGRISVNGKQDHFDVRMLTPQPLQGFESPEPRHRDIEHHNIGSVGLDIGQDFLPVAGFVYNFEVFLRFEQSTQTLTNDAMVVGDEDRDHSKTVHELSGRARRIFSKVDGWPDDSGQWCR